MYVIHENDAWVVPLRREFALLGCPYSEWFLDTGPLDLARRRRRACSTIG